LYDLQSANVLILLGGMKSNLADSLQSVTLIVPILNPKWSPLS